MDYQCTSCASGEIQKLSLVYESGKSTINATTRGTSTGIGFARGGIGIGSSVSSSRTTGIQLTETAKRAAPPARKKAAAWVATGLVVLLLGSVFGMVLTAVLLVGCGALAYFGFKYNREVFPGLMESWQSSWLCHRCGSVFELR